MKKRKLINILMILLIIIIVLFLFIYFLFIHHYKGKHIEYNWSSSDEFKIEDIVTINKDKNKDFVILNFADIQMCDLEDIFYMNKIKKELSYFVKEIKPDLITLTGDQTWSNENLISIKTLISFLDSLKIPYAPVFGNHDIGNKIDSAVISSEALATLYENGKYSLFSRGPTNLGSLGNYCINIMEDNKIYKTLYMMNSSYSDEITDEQIEWFKWTALGIKEYNNNTYSDALLFLHKPLPEYRDAYFNYLDGANNNLTNEIYVYYSLSGSTQKGFFDIIKESGVNGVICGHQHGNLFNLDYKGVILSFALKTGELGGYINNNEIYLNGATSIILNDTITYKNNFAPKNKFHIKEILL